MKIEEEEPLKDYAKVYFKTLLDNVPDNLKVGDELKMGVRFQREDGSWYDVIQVTVNKSELDDKA